MVAFACSGSAFREGDAGTGGKNAKGDETSTNSNDSITMRPREGGQGGRPVVSPETDETMGGAPDVVPDAVGATSTGGAAGGAKGAGTAGAVTGGMANTAGTSTGGVAGTMHGEGGAAGALNNDPAVCDSPVVEEWNQWLDDNHEPPLEINRWRVDWGDPYVDVPTHRLVLSEDDIAARNTALVGGYYVTTEVTIMGSTVFTPYPYVWEVMLPSIRRNAAGTGLDFGVTAYGTYNEWSATGWEGVTSAVGGNKLLVTMYVKTGADKGEALKVVYEGKVYRSAWVTDFHWAKTNLGMVRYVGENNSSVLGGSDVVYVGRVGGCQNLSDAAVTALFNSNP